MSRYSMLIVFTLLFVTLLSFVPLSADNTVVYHYNAQYEVGTWVENPCLVPSEWIWMTGTEHIEFSYKPGDASFQDHWRLSDRLTGVGEMTGTQYSLNNAYTENVNLDVDSSHIVVNARNLVNARGKAPNFHLKFHYRFAIRDGELILEEITRTTECTGG